MWWWKTIEKPVSWHFRIFRKSLGRLLLILFFPLSLHAQYNVDRLIVSGQVALHYEDYVLAIQYFNLAINQKPFLYQPWQYRAVAKFYLDDFVGSEQDASKAIELNPYIDGLFDLRAIDRIRQKKYELAIADYDKAIKISPRNRNYWINRAICRYNVKDYEHALLDADTIISKWNNIATPYSLKAEIYLEQKDTTEAANWLDKSLEIDPYDVEAWTTRAYISLNRRQWKQAEEFLSKAIHLRPNLAGNYVNRALARLNLNNLRGTMADYDKAIELEPNNFLAHYNRGLLRVQVGDDNRAIEDFDFVVKMEPGNIMAVYNRALLNDKVGNLRAAIRDYSSLIAQFPNFWAGLANRANCYRRLGMTAKAEEDEFRIFKAQMNKHIGIQQRWSKAKLRQVRKRSEIDLSKYNQIVVDDEPPKVEHEYNSVYRGQVQNREVDEDFMPMYRLSYYGGSNGVRTTTGFDSQVDRMNHSGVEVKRLIIDCGNSPLTEAQTQEMFHLIDTISAYMGRVSSARAKSYLLLQRSVAYSVLQNYESAIADVDEYLKSDSTSALAWWQRGVSQSMANGFEASQGRNVSLNRTKAEGAFGAAIRYNSNNAYLYYNRGCLMASNKEYGRAIDDFTRAISVNPQLAEAWYNRGLARMKSGNKEGALTDLSKAGEMGIYKAYALAKKIK